MKTPDTVSASRDRRSGSRPGFVQLLIVTLITTLPAMAIVSLVPVIPLLLKHFASTPHAGILVPIIVTAPGACIALLSPFAGLIADRFGRRRVVLFALLLYGLAGSMPLILDTVVTIIGSRLLLGVAEAALVTTGYALVADYFPQEERGRWLSMQAAIGSCLAALLTLAGGVMADISWRAPFLLYLVAFPLFVACLKFIREPSPSEEEQPAMLATDGFPWRIMCVVAGVTLFSATLFYSYIVQIGLVFSRLGLDRSGYIGLAGGVAACGVILGAFLYRACQRLTLNRQLFIVFGLIGAGLTGVSLAQNWGFALAGAFVEQLGAGMLVPTLAAWNYRFLPFAYRNRGTGIWVASFFMGQFSCPLAVALIQGIVSDQQKTILVFGVMAIVAGVVGLLLGQREIKQRRVPSYQA